jgi:hypothetical protein
LHVAEELFGLKVQFAADVVERIEEWVKESERGTAPGRSAARQRSPAGVHPAADVRGPARVHRVVPGVAVGVDEPCSL